MGGKGKSPRPAVTAAQGGLRARVVPATSRTGESIDLTASTALNCSEWTGVLRFESYWSVPYPTTLTVWVK